jgi:hypothetical protein
MASREATLGAPPGASEDNAMASDDITKGNKLSMLTTAASFAGTIVVITLAWGKLDSRIALAEQRLVQLEAQQLSAGAKRDSDNTALATLSGKVEVSNERLQSLSEQFKRFEARLDDAPRRR